MSARREIVLQAHDALNSGDLGSLLPLCAPDFRLDMSDRVLNPAVYERHEGIRHFYAEVTEMRESFTWEPVDMREQGDAVVVQVHSTGKGRGSGLELDRNSAMLWRAGQKKASSLTFYRDAGQALEAAQD